MTPTAIKIWRKIHEQQARQTLPCGCSRKTHGASKFPRPIKFSGLRTGKDR